VFFLEKFFRFFWQVFLIFSDFFKKESALY
jgi:hypothetical protein